VIRDELSQAKCQVTQASWEQCSRLQ